MPCKHLLISVIFLYLSCRDTHSPGTFNFADFAEEKNRTGKKELKRFRCLL